MKGWIMGVDFVHPDCDDNHMMLRVKTRKGGIIGGECAINYLAREIPFEHYKQLCEKLVGDDAGLGYDAAVAVATEMHRRQLLVSSERLIGVE